MFQPFDDNSLVIQPADSLFTTTLPGVACCIDSPFPTCKETDLFLPFLIPKHIIRFLHGSYYSGSSIYSIETVHVNVCSFVIVELGHIFSIEGFGPIPTKCCLCLSKGDLWVTFHEISVAVHTGCFLFIVEWMNQTVGFCQLISHLHQISFSHLNHHIFKF